MDFDLTVGMDDVKSSDRQQAQTSEPDMNESGKSSTPKLGSNIPENEYGIKNHGSRNYTNF